MEQNYHQITLLQYYFQFESQSRTHKASYIFPSQNLPVRLNQFCAVPCIGPGILHTSFKISDTQKSFLLYSAVRHFSVVSGLVNIQRSANQKIKRRKEKKIQGNISVKLICVLHFKNIFLEFLQFFKYLHLNSMKHSLRGLTIRQLPPPQHHHSIPFQKRNSSPKIFYF